MFLAVIEKPLRDGLEKLIGGILPLNPTVPDDILNLLSSPEHSKILHKYLPSEAYLVAAKKGKLPDKLTKLFDDQVRFENIRHDLIARLQSLKHVSNSGIDADKAIEALETLWHDFNCIASRILLEMTADSRAAMEFLGAG
ncbi:hypothetical protein N7475_009464 [Penicillium sp. IBT 31633x]|nr:hypothetical protein N7475_009464 [Penicillium sp. IBT 31633x]